MVGAAGNQYNKKTLYKIMYAQYMAEFDGISDQNGLETMRSVGWVKSKTNGWKSGSKFNQ